MDTINEVTNSESEQGQEGSEPTRGGTGSATAEYPKCQRESTINSSRRNGTQETTMISLNPVREETDYIKPPYGSLTDTEKVTSLRTSFKAAPQSSDDLTGGDLEESELPSNSENKLALEDTEEVTTQTETENSTLQGESLDTTPIKITENGVMKSHEGTEQFALGNGSVLVQHNRAFTTEEVDDQPVHV